MRFKLTGVLLAFVLSAGLGSAVSAQASTQGPVANAAGCRAAPYSASFNLYFETEPHLDLGTYTTTPQCRDINLSSTSGTSYRACVIFVRLGSRCNYDTAVPASGAWVNIATNVKDGTRFNVRIYKGGANHVRHTGVMDF